MFRTSAAELRRAPSACTCAVSSLPRLAYVVRMRAMRPHTCLWMMTQPKAFAISMRGLAAGSAVVPGAIRANSGVPHPVRPGPSRARAPHCPGAAVCACSVQR